VGVVGMMELKPFYDYELTENIDQLFEFRLKIEQAQKELKRIKELADQELIRRMKEQNIESFETQLSGMKNKIYYAEEKKEKITDPKRLEKMLFEGEDNEAELARRCLSFSASAWKPAKVRELADTLGIDRKELIETNYGQKIEVKILPIELLEKKGVI
jgi:hypothetical protein